MNLNDIREFLRSEVTTCSIGEDVWQNTLRQRPRGYELLLSATDPEESFKLTLACVQGIHKSPVYTKEIYRTAKQLHHKHYHALQALTHNLLYNYTDLPQKTKSWYTLKEPQTGEWHPPTQLQLF